MTTTTMTTISVTLPKQLVEKANEKGLLASDAIEDYLREKLDEPQTTNAGEANSGPEEETGDPDDSDDWGGSDPIGVDSLGREVYANGAAIGDIISPIFTDEELKEMWERKWGDFDPEAMTEENIRIVEFVPVASGSSNDKNTAADYSVNVMTLDEFIQSGKGKEGEKIR